MHYNQIPLLYEDNHLLVVCKPQNLPAQGDASGDPDLLSLLKAYLKESKSKPGEAFLGLVHRLDRPTGGVMVFAKTSKAASRISEEMRQGDIEKKYLAVVLGKPRTPKNNLVHYLLKDEKSNSVRIVPSTTEGAKRAELAYKTLETGEKISLLEIELQTGRSHQIRVQMQTIGHPVFGDAKYGGDALAKGHNLALWAHELRFKHPVSGETLVFLTWPPKEEAPWNVFNIENIMSAKVK